ncbi:MAG: response regulator [Deltaproteobacteria bacterium]|nr:response regulator [Deltaproteobacteria bacterium]
MADKKLKILVVEDNFMNKVLVKEILTLNGYEIVEASTGAEAIKAAKAEMPDLVLMDLHLPEVDGFTATRIIKQDAHLSAIPVVALTASAMKGDREKIVTEGFDGYVQKPIDIKKLIEELEACLKAAKK